MKISLLLIILLIGCQRNSPRFQVGDCVNENFIRKSDFLPSDFNYAKKIIKVEKRKYSFQQQWTDLDGKVKYSKGILKIDSLDYTHEKVDCAAVGFKE